MTLDERKARLQVMREEARQLERSLAELQYLIRDEEATIRIMEKEA